MTPASRPVRVAILHGTNYWNMGDLGLVTACVQRLQEAGATEVVSLSRFHNEPRTDGQTFTIESLGVREVPFLALPYPRLRSKWRHLAHMSARALGLGAAAVLIRRGLGAVVPAAAKRRLAPLLEADVVVSKPGGFLHHHMAIDHLLQIWIATMTGRPVVIYGQSIGPFSARWQRMAAGTVLRRCRLLLLRDEASVDVCTSSLRLPRERLQLTADEGFLLQPAASEEGDRVLRDAGVPQNRPVIGLTAIQWHFPDAADADVARQRYLEAIVALIDHVHRRYDADVALFTFAHGRAYGRNDEGVSAEVIGRVRDPARVHRVTHTDPRTLKAALGRLDAFVGSRMHSNIFSLGAETPALAIAYLPKTRGIMRMVGLERHVVPIDDIDANALTAAFDRVWCEQDEVRAHLQRTLPDIRERARQNARATLVLTGSKA